MNLSYERRLWKKGYKCVVGVDEVGRGPLAGPVVAAAVVFPSNVKIKGLDDSKKLTPKKREELFYEIKKKALGIGVGRVNHKLIDKLNIGRANLLAMKKAVENLPFFPDYLLIDGGRHKIDLPIKQRGISGGDGKCASIAAASIVAKVIRDRIMLRYHQKYPRYKFDRHKGYGTREHMRKISKFGPCLIHRRSFYPISQFCKS
ncbi:MAG: ribonuclease HII [Candidatus Margulisiibacteriota bacterium]